MGEKALLEEGRWRASMQCNSSSKGHLQLLMTLSKKKRKKKEKAFCLLWNPWLYELCVNCSVLVLNRGCDGGLVLPLVKSRKLSIFLKDWLLCSQVKISEQRIHGCLGESSWSKYVSYRLNTRMTYYTPVFCSERGPFLKLYGKLLFPHLLINVNKGGSLGSCTFFSHPFPLPSEKRKKSCYCCAEKYDLVRRTESTIWMSSWLEKMRNMALMTAN